jgi:hypothetical protein
MPGTDALHSELEGINIHTPFAFIYADTAAREAEVGATAADVGKMAWQQDNNTLWILQDDDPLTWSMVGTTDAAGITYTPAAATDWDGDADPGNVDDALDQLAARIDDVEPYAIAQIATLNFVIDGGGAAITTGIKGDIELPWAGAISQVTMLADQSGSIVVDIWKDTYANFPPDDADSITGAAPPTITNAQKSQDATLTGWTTSVAADDILRFNVDSCTGITRCTVSLKLTRTA